MAINAATLNIGIGVTGADGAVAAIRKVEKSAGNVTDKIGTAARTAANFGASMANAGKLSATALSGIVQQAGEIAFMFGPAGAVVGAIATTGIAIATMFFKAQQEAEKFEQSLRKLSFDNDFRGAVAQLNDLDFQISEANRKLAQAKAEAATAGRSSEPVDAATAQALATIRDAANRKERNAQEEVNKLLAKRVEIVKVSQDLAVKVGEQQAIGLKLAQEQAAAAEREAAAQKAAAQAIRDKAQAQKDSEAARAALAKASEGITLGGPAVDLGTGDLSRAPTIPVQVAPIFSVDNASILALQEQIKEILEAEFNQKFLAVNLEFAKFGQNVVEGLAGALGEAAGHGFSNAGGIILGALGGIFKKMGSALIAYGAAMKALLPHLLNPFTSGPAAIAAGVLLVAVGTALSGLATGAGGGGGGGYSPAIGSVTNPAHVTNVTIGGSGTQGTAAGLSPMQPITFNVFGENDPVAQRVLVNTLDNARRRGL